MNAERATDGTPTQPHQECELVGFAGLGVSITTICEPLREMIRSCYSGFSATSASFSLEAIVLPNDGAAPACSEIEVARENGLILLNSGSFSAEIDTVRRRARVRQPCAVYPIDACLRVVYNALRHEHGWFLLHASGVVREGRSYVFTGPSGSGKSTIIDVLGGTRLADEIVAIRATPAGFVAAGTPYWEGTNTFAPIGGLFALRQSESTRFAPHSPVEMARLVFQSICTLGMDGDDIAALFHSCCALAESVPCGELRFSLDAEAIWRAIGLA